jgi:cytidylate kinase
MSRPYYQIAIDGYSSCGKSTLAKDLAKAIHFTHIDSGAMYRAVSLYIFNHDIPVTDHHQISEVVDSLNIDFVEHAGRRLTRLNGRVVEEDIREQRISDIVSQVSIIGAVRTRLVNLQRQLSEKHNVIMEGRDIGTVVFPRAHIKLFLTASIDVRVERRWMELQLKNKIISKEEIKQNLLLRDHIDSTRKIAPLKKAPDAIEIDNTELDRKSQLNYVLTIVHDRLGISPNK